MNRSRTRLLYRLVATSVILAGYGLGQSGLPRTVGPLDGDVLIPVPTGVIGQKDAAALTELANDLAAVGTSPWGGMQGTGTITIAQDPTPYSATLSNLGGDCYRLDAQLTKGAMSIRIHHRMGKIQDSDGTVSVLPPETASLELFPFALLRAPHFPSASASLLDHGLVSVGGAELHRITFEFAGIGRNPATKSTQTNAIDLYFDPTSHLLIKSATSIHLVGGRQTTFLSVVTYGDYRRVATSMVPFRYTETLQGQQYRTLQLSSVQLNPALSPTYFEF